MSKLATNIQTKISKYCRENYLVYNKTIGMSKSGFPDIIVVKNSVTYFFEVKTKNDKLSKLQEVTIEKMNLGCEVAFVVGSLEDFKQIIEERNYAIKFSK